MLLNLTVDYLAVAAATLVAAAATISFLSGALGTMEDETDITLSVLSKTAPKAASDELSGSLMTCGRKLNGVELIITKDPKVADYVFNGSTQRNYTRRPASSEGLKMLGMHNRGLIWNNDLSSWKVVRRIFQLSLNDVTMEKAVRVIKKDALSLVESSIDKETGFVDMMNICRRLTFRASLSTFFGIEASDYIAMGIRELDYIDSIVNYFKAWEYFLLRPKTHWDRSLEIKHSKAVGELQNHVKSMLQSLTNNQPVGTNKDNLFIDKLRAERNEELLVQSALEMMLAGTDTSSVTAYYTLLGISSDQALQADIRRDIIVTSGGPSKSKLLRSVIDETLRFKPVGPVVLREAVEDDPNFPGFNVKKGTAILIHLADMNLCEKTWSNPTAFCPRRFMVSDEEKQAMCDMFFPFGMGPKGCIGMHLGLREVTAILESVLLNYSMDIAQGDSTLGCLETHWDIANQPENPTQIKMKKL